MGKQRNGVWYDNRYSLKKEKYSKAPRDLPAYYENWKYASLYAKANKLGRIFDFGCGPAHFASVLKEYHPGIVRYEGYDFSSVAIKMANKMTANLDWCRCRQADIFTLDIPFIEGMLCTCFELLEHIDNDLNFLKKLPASVPVIFTVPGFDSDGHTRHFTSKKQIIKRYSSLLDIEDIVCTHSIYRVTSIKRKEL